MGKLRDAVEAAERRLGLLPVPGATDSARMDRLLEAAQRGERRLARLEADVRDAGAECGVWVRDSVSGEPRPAGEVAHAIAECANDLGRETGKLINDRDRERQGRLLLESKIAQHAAALYPERWAAGGGFHDTAAHSLAVEAMGVDLAQAWRQLREGAPADRPARAMLAAVAELETALGMTPPAAITASKRVQRLIDHAHDHGQRLGEVQAQQREPLPVTDAQGPLVHHLSTRIRGAVAAIAELAPAGLVETLRDDVAVEKLPDALDWAVSLLAGHLAAEAKQAERLQVRAEAASRYGARLTGIVDRLRAEVDPAVWKASERVGRAASPSESTGPARKPGVGGRLLDLIAHPAGPGAQVEPVAPLVDRIMFLIAYGPSALRGYRAPAAMPEWPLPATAEPVQYHREGVRLQVCGVQDPHDDFAVCQRNVAHPGPHARLVPSDDERRQPRMAWWRELPAAPRPGGTVEVIEQFRQLPKGAALLYRPDASRPGGPLRSLGTAPALALAERDHGVDIPPSRWAVTGVGSYWFTDHELVTAAGHGEFTLVDPAVGS